MKKLLILAVLLLGFCPIASADISISETVKKIPLKQGVVYSLRNNEISHVSTAQLIEKWGASFEVGYSDNGKLVSAVTYPLIEAKDYVNVPLLKELSFKPGYFVSWDELDSGGKVDHGLIASLLTLTW